VTREDRSLVDELAILNRGRVPLAVSISIMEDTGSAAEQVHYAGKLITTSKRLQRRADQMAGIVIDGEVLANRPLIFLPYNNVLCWKR
jgi:flagellar biosynthesis/type III secretory pathway chaperone